ncbi:MAG: DinB family protein [Acidobacteria bacterium]|nr:MAG: DinB family protein [Acidobacteriota bacterium]
MGGWKMFCHSELMKKPGGAEHQLPRIWYHSTMLTADLTRLFVRELETFQREVEMFPDDQSLWKTLPGVANSAGNLGAHLAGNVQHFIGAILGKSGYVRHRDHEFSRRAGTRAEIVADLQAAIDAAKTYLPALTPADLEREYPESVGGVKMATGLFLMHLASHAAFHLGQADYLRRTLLNDARTAGTLPLKPLEK